MIDRGMDVKELVNSPLFYVPIWTRQTAFSPEEETKVVGYNDEIDDLELEDHHVVFGEEIINTESNPFSPDQSINSSQEE